MPVERRGQVTDVGSEPTGNRRSSNSRRERQPSFGGTSRMTRECQVRICERLGVKLPGPTRQRCGKRRDLIPSGKVQEDERKRTADDASKSARRCRNRGDFVNPGRAWGVA